ncbi:MAG TPA: flavodoxin family protein [Planctomycetota bacterium]|jgi:multimeric flavodoxin WrbA
MKILTVLGSPRVKGNTARVLDWVEDELRASKHEASRIDIQPGNMAPCSECFVCKGVADKPGCSHQDQAVDIFNDMLFSDLTVLASPLFCWGVSAQLKTLLDRAFCLLKKGDNGNYRSLIAGRRLALVVTGGGELEGNLDLVVPPYKAFAEYFQCKDAGVLLLPYCSEPDSLGAGMEKQAREFARKIAG